MILFADDWKRFPNAIVDTQTTNRTFVRMAQLYQSMGIKNHAFPLALLQPELQGVDPHSPNLTYDQKAKIGMECRFNIWYYLREVIRIPPVAGPVAVPYRANRGNMALTWLFMNHIDTGLIQPRQTGKSVSTDCLSVWIIYVGATNSRMIMLTKDDSLRKSNVERLKKIRDLLPPYLVNMSSSDSDNQFELTCKALENRYTTGVGQNSENDANKLGRGLTSPVLHSDEGPFTNYIGVTLPAALASGNAARDEAKKFGRPYGNIFTTTAGKKDDRDGRYMYDMFQAAAPWYELYLDSVDHKDLMSMVKANRGGKKYMVNCTFSHRQLGYTDEWLYEKIAETGSTGEAADRDFLNIWTSGSQRSPLSIKLNEIIKSSELDFAHSTISSDRYILRWYVPEEEIDSIMDETHTVIGMDTSDAVGRDAISFVVTDVRDLATLAAGKFNETFLPKLANFVADFMIKYPKSTLVIERKSSAQTFIDTVIVRLVAAGQDPFKRIFNRIVDDAKENEDSFKELLRRPDGRSEAFYESRKKTFGFVTTGESRGILYKDVLQNAAKQAGHLVRDRDLTTEILGLVEKNGRIDHQASGHDDMVIAWLLNHWFLTHGRNLSHYGIPTGEIMSDITEQGVKMTEEDLYQKHLQEERIQQIDSIISEMQDVEDEFLLAKYEHKIRHLAKQVSTSGLGDSISIDALIRQANEDRKNKRRMQALSTENRQRLGITQVDPYELRQSQQQRIYQRDQRLFGENMKHRIDWC